MNRFSINDKGYWETDNEIGHVHDSELCKSIINFFNRNKIINVVDLGCGMGNYARSFVSEGIFCDAFDGNPNTEVLTGGLGKVLDFSVPFNLNKKYDCVMSLEVGEHIPKQYESTFIQNLCNHSNGWIILSWAVIGQGGDGHVNCQNNDYIVDELSKLNFQFNLTESNNLRKYSTLSWFKDTIMVFEKI